MAKRMDFRLRRFSGLCASGDATGELKDGESPEMINFRITPGGGLKKRGGYRVLRRFEADLRGFWQGKLNGGERACAVAGNRFLAGRDWDHLADLGEIGGTGEVTFFPFGLKLYLLTGRGIWTYTGSAFAPLVPYVPLVMIETAPDGTGTLYEEVNALTPEVRQEFDLSGPPALDFYLALEPTGITDVTIGGRTVQPSDYYWNVMQNCLSFYQAPVSQNEGPMTVQYFAANDNDVSDGILGCRRAARFGGANDTRAFLYGSRLHPAARFHSGLVEGVPLLEYFPASGYTLVGDSNPITAILRQYDRQIIFTEKAAYYSTLEYREGAGGKLVSTFPVYPLSDERGCSAAGQAVLMQNDPVTLSGGDLCRWISTNVRDERNAHVFSQAIAPLLKEEDPADALLFNRRAASELYAAFPEKIFVYQYELGVFYYFETPRILSFLEDGGELYFMTARAIAKAEGDTDDGEPVAARWSSKDWDLGEPGRLKNLYSVRLTAVDTGAGSVTLTAVTEKSETEPTVFTLTPPGTPGAEISARRRLRPRRFRRIRIRLTDAGETPIHLTGIELSGSVGDEKA